MKYKLTDETKTTEYGVVLHRICALVDIQRWGVCKGDLGGWVENESNLDQDGDAWIFSDATKGSGFSPRVTRKVPVEGVEAIGPMGPKVERPTKQEVSFDM